MSAHTPGPWSVADLPHSIVVRTQSPKKSKFGADRYAAIGGFDRDDLDQLLEAMANARLIAAAPELLEALQGMERWAAEIYDGYPASTASEHAKPFREAARKALAKATGEQQ